MKKLYFLLVLGLSLPVAAETISSVSYNPSRLGQYQKLKVADGVVFLQGLQTDNLYVTNESRFTWEGQGIYDINGLTSTGDTGLSVSDGVFQGPTGNLSSYSATNTSPALGGGLTLNLAGRGGKVWFFNDSFATNLTRRISDSPALRSYADTINVGTLSITGEASPDELLAEDFTSPEELRAGLRLAGGDIPDFTENVEDKTLAWCPRNACIGDSTNCSLLLNNSQEVMLLGYDCGKPAGTNPPNCRWVYVDVARCQNIPANVYCDSNLSLEVKIRSSSCWLGDNGAGEFTTNGSKTNPSGCSSTAAAGTICHVYRSNPMPEVCSGGDYPYTGTRSSGSVYRFQRVCLDQEAGIAL